MSAPGKYVNKVQELQEAVLRLQSHTALRTDERELKTSGNILLQSFPGHRFPAACIHEFISNTNGAAAASDAFIGALLHTFLPSRNHYLWVHQKNQVFPPGLLQMGIQPDKIIFAEVRSDREALWVMEEGLKCKGMEAVIGEVRELGFTESRRLQLAAEKAGVTGFVHRQQPRAENVVAAASRWKVSTLPGLTEQDLPGLGFPRWAVRLTKVRNGKPNNWDLEWTPEGFRRTTILTDIKQTQRKSRQTG